MPGMKAEFDSGEWASDDLLSWVLDNMESFWWQSHTLAHLARDNLGQSDCDIEDGGEVVKPIRFHFKFRVVFYHTVLLL